MANTFTKAELVEHLNRHFDDETLLVIDIWSSADVEMHLADLDDDEEDADKVIDKSMDIWADIADSFVEGFDNTTSMLNDLLFELIQEADYDR